MNDRTTHRTARRCLGAIAVALASLALVDGMPVAAGSAPTMRQLSTVQASPAVVSAASIMQPMPTVTVSGTVLNTFVRDCSHITRRCTRYRQINGPFNPYVGSRYSTRWVWRLIW
jgi:hypothetical protein